VRVTDQAHRLADAFEESMKTNLPDLPADLYAELAELVGPEIWRILAHSARTGFPSSLTVAEIVRLLATRAEATR
jgi:hypothetical protein